MHIALEVVRCLQRGPLPGVQPATSPSPATAAASRPQMGLDTPLAGSLDESQLEAFSHADPVSLLLLLPHHYLV